MKKLKCDCGNETEFVERTVVKFTVDADGSREEKICELNIYYCAVCSQQLYQEKDGN